MGSRLRNTLPVTMGAARIFAYLAYYNILDVGDYINMCDFSVLLFICSGVIKLFCGRGLLGIYCVSFGSY